MNTLAHIAIVIALIPGSLLFIVVGLWRILRFAVGFKRPTLPLRTPLGAVVYTEADWRKDSKTEYPIRYAVFEELPIQLKRLGRRIIRPFRLPTTREVILAGAFNRFSDWVDSKRIVMYALSDDEEGPRARANARTAEIHALYQWWNVTRPAQIVRIEEMHVDIREFGLVDLELDDEHNFARLANIWRSII